jgi:hypothetical protein
VLGEEGGGGGVEGGGGAAVEFGADGVEIHEPALEQRPRHRLQRRVHPPVQLDLVVQRPKHRRDGFLLGEGWKLNGLFPQCVSDKPSCSVSCVVYRCQEVWFVGEQPVGEKRTIDILRGA